MSQDSNLATRVITSAMSLPIVKVNRDDWLYTQLNKHCPLEQAAQAVADRPAQAGVPIEVIDKIADSVIRRHVGIASSASFATGIPGGWAMAATIPADLAQFYGVALSLTQKLAYLYGWPDLTNEEGHFDEDTETRIILFLGIMLGAAHASQATTYLSQQIAKESLRRIPRYAMTKHGTYNIAKRVLALVGFKLTKQGLARGVAKFVPIVGGVASGGITAVGMSTMAGNLKRHLRGLELAQPGPYSESETIEGEGFTIV